MDAFDNITLIPGSRHPILIPAAVHFDASSSTSQTPGPPSTDSSKSLFPPHRSRRKPARVFKSPTAADSLAEWEARTALRKRGTPPYEKPQSRRPSSEADRVSPPISIPARRASAQRKVPLLPLYHPLGALAQSLPALDPGQFGLPGSSLNIEDPDDQRDGDANGRSTSRTQRPSQKTRERETAEVEPQPNGVPNGTGKPAAGDAPARNPSPRKRRGGGGKRKRKDADDGDTAFPAPPAKRTRNPRGANNAPAAPSPLISEAVVASDLVEDADAGNAEGEEGAPVQEDTPPAPKRSARTRKPRTRPAKRRDSSGSASTATSVSVSIAATAKPGAQVEASSEPAAEVAPKDKAPPAAEPETEAPVAAKDPDTSRGSKVVEKEAADPPAVSEARRQGEPPATVAPAVVPKHKETPPQAVAPAAPPAPVHPPTPPPVPPPQKEEREEGELSDDA